MKNPLRTKNNGPTPIYKALTKDAQPIIAKLVKKYAKNLHPDFIEIALCREVGIQCTLANLDITVKSYEK